MNRGLLSFLLVLASAAAGSTQTPPQPTLTLTREDPASAESTARVAALFDAFAEAWNAADSERLAGLFDPHEGRVRSFKESFQGHDRVRDWFAGVLAGPHRGSRLQVLEARAQLELRRSVDVLFELTPEGGRPRRGEFEALVATVDGELRIRRLWAYEFGEPPSVGPVRIGRKISAPRKVHDERPVYPDIAKQARVQGVVILECVISPTGEVVEAEVLRGIPLLDLAAIEAVRQWRYEPTLVDGKAVPVIMTITVSFNLS